MSTTTIQPPAAAKAPVGAPAFAGFSRDTVAAVVGPEAAARVSQIDHQHMEYGVHWRWTHGRQVITEAGLIVLARELRRLGHARAAESLDLARIEAVKQCVPEPPAAPAAGPVEPRNFLQAWELEHEQ